MNKVLVIIPAHNEEALLPKTLQELKQLNAYDVLVVDDNSYDNTLKYLKSENVKHLSLPCQLGAWGATQTGLRYGVSQKKYDYFIAFDADGQHDSMTIDLLLYSLIHDEADLVIGACPERGSLCRKIAWRLLRLTSGLNVKDLTSGFRAYSFRAASLLSSAQASGLDYQDVGVLCFLRKAGLRIKEVEVCMRPRSEGKSRIFCSWFSVVQYMVYSLLLAVSNFRIR